MNILIPVLIVGGLGLLFGLLLAYTSKKFEVAADPRVEELKSSLPGANCGACGFSGCEAYANAIVSSDAKLELCTVGGSRVAKMIGKIMGVDVKTSSDVKARVMCKGITGVSGKKYKYSGIKDCSAAALLYAGPGDCAFGCVGMGDCVRVCQFCAISVQDGVAVVDEEMCTACGMCVNKCPKNLIRLIPVGVNATVRCSNKEKGAAARKICKVSCIACGRCVKACPSGAMTIDNLRAVIDYNKCTDCGECAKVCPTRACDGGVR
jgi:Na+-translocating ferredoxin:NAD+ oxidoreductase RNF subunit RnfB